MNVICDPLAMLSVMCTGYSYTGYNKVHLSVLTSILDLMQKIYIGASF